MVVSASCSALGLVGVCILCIFFARLFYALLSFDSSSFFVSYSFCLFVTVTVTFHYYCRHTLLSSFRYAIAFPILSLSLSMSNRLMESLINNNFYNNVEVFSLLQKKTHLKIIYHIAFSLIVTLPLY